MDFLSDEIKQALTSPEKLAEYRASMQRLMNSSEWKLLMSCILYCREQTIDGLKVATPADLPGYQTRLNSLDLLKSLPEDFIAAIRHYAEENGIEDKDDGYGYTQDTPFNTPPTS